MDGQRHISRGKVDRGQRLVDGHGDAADGGQARQIGDGRLEGVSAGLVEGGGGVLSIGGVADAAGEREGRRGGAGRRDGPGISERRVTVGVVSVDAQVGRGARDGVGRGAGGREHFRRCYQYRDRGGAAEGRAGVGGNHGVGAVGERGGVQAAAADGPTGAAGSYRPGEGRLVGHRLAKLVPVLAVNFRVAPQSRLTVVGLTLMLVSVWFTVTVTLLSAVR